MNQRVHELTQGFEKPAGASAGVIQAFRKAVRGSVPQDYLDLAAQTNGAFGDVTGTEALVKLVPIEEVVAKSRE